MKSKRGGIVDENVDGVILAVVAIFLLVFLMVNLFSPSFNKEDKTAKSYFNMLKESVDVADAGKVGSFYMYGEGKEINFYLVYFGEAFSFSDYGLSDKGKGIIFIEKPKSDIAEALLGDEEESVKKEFIRDVKNNKKNLCICYSKENKVLCDYCMSLESPVAYPATTPWVAKEGSRINIRKAEGLGYAFSDG